jgi:signal transduction histidine kinase
MKESPTDEALISQGLEVLQRNSITLSRLVEDLVDISKIAAGALTLEFEDLDLKQIVVSSVKSLRLKAAEKGIALKSSVEIPDDVECRVRDAEVRLQQILANILSNSLKFTPDQGAVTVILKTAQERAIVVAKDTGVGASIIIHCQILIFSGLVSALITLSQKHQFSLSSTLRDCPDASSGNSTLTVVQRPGPSLAMLMVP